MVSCLIHGLIATLAEEACELAWLGADLRAGLRAFPSRLAPDLGPRASRALNFDLKAGGRREGERETKKGLGNISIRVWGLGSSP